MERYELARQGLVVNNTTGPFCFYADAQATIAALQARVRELEQWVQDQSTANLETMRHTDEMQSRALEAEQQLTQHTSELEAANTLLYKKNCALGRAETSINDLQAELERVRGERDHAKKMEAVQKEVADNQTWHVQKLEDWRDTVTLALQRPGGARFEDVPEHIKALVKEHATLRQLVEVHTKQLTELTIIPIGCSREQELRWTQSIKDLRATLAAQDAGEEVSSA